MSEPGDPFRAPDVYNAEEGRFEWWQEGEMVGWVDPFVYEVLVGSGRIRPMAKCGPARMVDDLDRFAAAVDDFRGEVRRMFEPVLRRVADGLVRFFHGRDGTS